MTDIGRVGGTDAFGVRFTQTSNFDTDVVEKMQGFYIHTYKFAEIFSINLGPSTNDFIFTTNMTYKTYSFKTESNNVFFKQRRK